VKYRQWIALIGLTLVVAVPATARGPAAAPNRDIVIENGLVYGKGGDKELQLDLARPQGDGPFPVVVGIHGGAWRLGSRKQLAVQLPWLGGRSIIEYFAARGFVAVTVGYRLAPDAQYPAMIEDCKAAVRWLRANAAKYHADPDHIASWGYSAGGHLACLLGDSEPADGLEGAGGHPEQSSKVQAVIDLFGPTDFTADWKPDVEEKVFAPLVGARFKDRPDLYRKASPLQLVRKGAPPHLIIHGTADNVVPLNQSKALAAKLKNLGVTVRYVEVEGKGHGWLGDDLTKTIDQSIDFLREQWKLP
jgi:acetyl esterase/lipase